MTHAEAFLHDILTHPDDDAPRLIFADWLEENGDPARAEFIRVQCELARVPEDRRRWDLEDRERQLREEHEEEWRKPLRALVRRYRFRRGFVEDVTIEAPAFLEQAPALFGLAPVRHLQLRRLRALEGVADLEAASRRVARYCDRLRTLDLSHELIRVEEVGHLFDFTPWPSLTALNLSRVGLGAAGGTVLAQAPLLGRLTWLDVRSSLGPQGVEALLTSPHLGRLEHLSLSANNLGDTGMIGLTASRRLLRLRSLALGHNRLGAADVRSLLASRLARQLTALDLSFNRLGADGARTLAAAASLPKLTALNLSHCELGDDGVRRLVANPWFGQLYHLDLSLNRIGDEGARALVDCPDPVRLHTLDLIYNSIGAEARRALCERFGERVCLFRR